MRRRSRPTGIAALAALAGFALLGMVLVSCGGPSPDPLVADAGEDMHARLGQTVVLSGSVAPAATDRRSAPGSRTAAVAAGDPAPRAATAGPAFRWSFLSRPSGSAAELLDAASAAARFVPDVVGDYELELSVERGGSRSSDDVRVTVAANGAPTADAGPERVVRVGAEVQLDGRASTDPDGDALERAWRFLDKPPASEAALNDAASATPRFTADAPGEYRLELRVSDGVWSDVDAVSVRANRPPQADAGAPQDAHVGEATRLDGSGSLDPDGDTLSYAWRFVTLPLGSTATLQAASSPAPTFTPDADGSYVLELRVSDGAADDRARVVVNVAPAAGVPLTTIYVSTSGDDTNDGGATSPLRTVGAAIAMAAGDADIRRVVLEAGSYDAEGFGYPVAHDLQVVGPDDPVARAVLDARGLAVAPDSLFEARAGAYLALVRIDMLTDGVAVRVESGASASLVGLTCEADACVRTGGLLRVGGAVEITASTLRAPAVGGSVGASSANGGRLLVQGSTIEGFDDGVSVLATPATVLGSTLRSNGTGLHALAGSASEAVVVSESTIAANGVGVAALAVGSLTLHDTLVVDNTDVGMRVDGQSGVLIDGASISDNVDAGLVIEEGASGAAGAVVTVRDSFILRNQGSAVAVHGKDTHLDLGTSGAPGNNSLGSWFRWGLEDARPSGATGFIVLSSTTLQGYAPPPGVYAGPLEDIGGNGVRRFKIANDNDLVAH